MIKKLSDQSLGSQFELEGEIIALLPINAMDQEVNLAYNHPN